MPPGTPHWALHGALLDLGLWDGATGGFSTTDAQILRVVWSVAQLEGLLRDVLFPVQLVGDGSSGLDVLFWPRGAVGFEIDLMRRGRSGNRWIVLSLV